MTRTQVSPFFQRLPGNGRRGGESGEDLCPASSCRTAGGGDAPVRDSGRCLAASHGECRGSTLAKHGRFYGWWLIIWCTDDTQLGLSRAALADAVSTQSAGLASVQWQQDSGNPALRLHSPRLSWLRPCGFVLGSLSVKPFPVEASVQNPHRPHFSRAPEALVHL